MNDQTVLYVVIGLVVLAAVIGLAFYFLRRRDTTDITPPPTPPTTTTQTPPATEAPPEAERDEATPATGPPADTATAPAPVDEPSLEVQTPEPVVDVPEPPASRMARLRSRLARSGALGSALLAILSRDNLSESDWEEIEETLLIADVGTGPTDELMDQLREFVKIEGTSDPVLIRTKLQEFLVQLLSPQMDRSLATDQVVGVNGEPHPATILMVGVNGTGKTTTVGKLARVLVAENKDVVLGAADTFRAAAAEQLTTWGERVGVPVVRSEREGADPASVAFDAVKVGQESGADVVLIDTAGRLQNKAGLMDELGKIKRVVEKSGPVSEVLLVIDATTGQNGLRQAQVFAEVVNVTGIVLTKLDGSAKGGIVVAVQRELGVPVKFVGLGEGPDDLAPFDPESFAEAIISA